MIGHRWNELEERALGILRLNGAEPSAVQRRRLRERLKLSAAAASTSRRVIYLDRKSHAKARRRVLGVALAALGSPIPLAAAFAAGGATGAVAFATIQYLRSPAPRTPEPAPLRAPAPVSTRSGLPVAPSTAPPSSTKPSPVEAQAHRPGPAAKAPRLPGRAAVDGSVRSVASSKAEPLAAQRALLDTARAALRRGDSAGALGAIEGHQRQYPNSVLCEEREALAIRALVGAGRHPEAVTRAARFRSRYPNSIMLPAIEERLGTIP